MKEPDQQHQTFTEVRADLKRLLDEVSGVTAAASFAPIVTNVDAAGPTRTPYVGRETERAEIRRLLDQAVSGRGAVVLIGGEPGVGKTRFTEELLREARERGCWTLGRPPASRASHG